ncbi:MAG: hypothetical protein OXB97_04430 [Rhodospirillales bacterium]|nr:hypothetical protein [Rhodospirillales bacterium]
MNEFTAAFTRKWPHVTVRVWRDGAWTAPPDDVVRAGERVRLDAVSGAYGVARGYLTTTPASAPAAPEAAQEAPTAAPGADPEPGSAPARPGDPPWLAVLAGAAAAMDAADPDRARGDWWLGDGRPKAAALAAEAGVGASAARRDAAWSRHLEG